jgi:hypothetical protein
MEKRREKGDQSKEYKMSLMNELDSASNRNLSKHFPPTLPFPFKAEEPTRVSSSLQQEGSNVKAKIKARINTDRSPERSKSVLNCRGLGVPGGKLPR